MQAFTASHRDFLSGGEAENIVCGGEHIAVDSSDGSVNREFVSEKLLADKRQYGTVLGNIEVFFKGYVGSVTVQLHRHGSRVVKQGQIHAALNESVPCDADSCGALIDSDKRASKLCRGNGGSTASAEQVYYRVARL